MAAGWLAIACCAVGIVACGSGRPQVPVELLGRWVTDAPEYEGRTLMISSSSLAFGAGKSASDVYSIRSIETEEATDGALRSAVTYEIGRERATLRLRLVKSDPPALWIGDRPEKWIPLIAAESAP